MPAPARIAVVGATGRVRRHAVSVLERTGLPVEATSRFYRWGRPRHAGPTFEQWLGSLPQHPLQAMP